MKTLQKAEELVERMEMAVGSMDEQIERLEEIQRAWSESVVRLEGVAAWCSAATSTIPGFTPSEP